MRVFVHENRLSNATLLDSYIMNPKDMECQMFQILKSVKKQVGSLAQAG